MNLQQYLMTKEALSWDDVTGGLSQAGDYIYNGLDTLGGKASDAMDYLGEQGKQLGGYIGDKSREFGKYLGDKALQAKDMAVAKGKELYGNIRQQPKIDKLQGKLDRATSHIRNMKLDNASQVAGLKNDALKELALKEMGADEAWAAKGIGDAALSDYHKRVAPWTAGLAAGGTAIGGLGGYYGTRKLMKLLGLGDNAKTKGRRRVGKVLSALGGIAGAGLGGYGGYYVGNKGLGQGLLDANASAMGANSQAWDAMKNNPEILNMYVNQAKAAYPGFN